MKYKNEATSFYVTFLSNRLVGIKFSISILSTQQQDSFFLFSIVVTALRSQSDIIEKMQRLAGDFFREIIKAFNAILTHRTNIIIVNNTQ